jgi:hypothetical protein
MVQGLPYFLAHAIVKSVPGEEAPKPLWPCCRARSILCAVLEIRSAFLEDKDIL